MAELTPFTDPNSPFHGNNTQNLGQNKTTTGMDVYNWFMTYLNRMPTPQEHAQYDGMDMGQFMQTLQTLQNTKTPAAAPPPPATGGGGGSGDNSGGTLGSLLQPVTTQMQTPTPVSFPGGPAGLPIPPTPTFNAPRMANIPDLQVTPFTPTTAQDVFADPSYEFQRGTGEQGITNSQAAQGMSRTGNSLIDILKYNQDYAGTAFNNIDSRRRADWTANTTNQLNTFGANVSKDEGVYDRDFQAALAEFQPQMEGYSTQAAAGQRQSEDNWSHAFQQWQQQFNIDQFNKTFPYTVLSDQQRLGLQAALG